MRVIREAAEWLQRLKSGDMDKAERRAYGLWMKEPRHAAEMMRTEFFDLGLERHIGAMMHSKRPDNVVDFESHKPTSRARMPEPAATKPAPRSKWKKRAIACAASLGLAAGVVLLATRVVTNDEVIVTRLGDWDRQMMADGSVIHAGPVTQLSFHMDESSRSVTQTRGEAFYDVAKDPTKPFIIKTSLGEVRVVGTEFAIAYKGGSVVVTVQEGKVQVTPTTGQPGSGPMQPVITLVANQQVVLSPDGLSEVATVNPSHEIKWILNWFESDGETVCEIVQQLNQRHGEKQVIVDREVCRRMRINSLAFRPSEPEAFVAKVNEWYGGYAGEPVLRLEYR